mmetsp:Transcript_16383/g.45692  ORF Transcript_16383/g.45692 Transcript_16383/m.45692 type:complete len:230 (-) Transcript_16383:858-1547(-)
MLLNTRILDCEGATGGATGAAFPGCPKAAFSAALATSSALIPGGKLPGAGGGAPAGGGGGGGGMPGLIATAGSMEFAAPGSVAPGMVWVIGMPFGATCVGAVGIGQSPMAASNKFSMSYPLTIILVWPVTGTAVMTGTTPMGAGATGITGAAAGTGAPLWVATRAVNTFPPPKSIPLRPSTATWVALGSAYSAKQYPLLVGASGSLLTKWNDFSFPNAWSNSSTCGSIK